jgi:hypothetical protein
MSKLEERPDGMRGARAFDQGQAYRPLLGMRRTLPGNPLHDELLYSC